METSKQMNQELDAILNDTPISRNPEVKFEVNKIVDLLEELQTTMKKKVEAIDFKPKYKADFSICRLPNIKTGNEKLVASIEDLTTITKKGLEQSDSETFLTTTALNDKTFLNSLFDATSVAALKVQNTADELEIKTLKNSIITEGNTLFTITATGSGYEARSLALTQGSFDIGLARFSYFFALLAAPIMLIASVYAGLIILGKN